MSYNIDEVAMTDQNISDLNKIAEDFEKKYGTLLLLKANMAAINRMLITKGKSEELLKSFKIVIEKFEKKLGQ
jgi:transcriptional regulator